MFSKMSGNRRILILCTGNSARSQMGEGLLRAAGRGDLLVESAGVRPGSLRPEAVTVMREIGIDISAHYSKSVDQFIGQKFDYIVTVCDNARETCPIFPGDAVHIHRAFPDPPAPGEADEATTLAAFRAVRDEIREWAAEFVEEISR